MFVIYSSDILLSLKAKHKLIPELSVEYLSYYLGLSRPGFPRGSLLPHGHRCKLVMQNEEKCETVIMLSRIVMLLHLK